LRVHENENKKEIDLAYAEEKHDVAAEGFVLMFNYGSSYHEKVNDGFREPDRLFRTIFPFNIHSTIMWMILITAWITLMILIGIHYFYDYLKQTLTIPKIHDLQTMESKKRTEIESILEET
jgi:hypothetical protein